MAPNGALALAAAIVMNATLKSLRLRWNNICDKGALALAAALAATATLALLDLWSEHVGAEGARALAATLDTSRTLHDLDLQDLDQHDDDDDDEGNGDKSDDDGFKADILALVADRLCVNELVQKVPAWVTSRPPKSPRSPDTSACLLALLRAPPCWRSASSSWT